MRDSEMRKHISDIREKNLVGKRDFSSCKIEWYPAYCAVTLFKGWKLNCRQQVSSKGSMWGFWRAVVGKWMWLIIFRFLLILFLEICEQHYKINFTHDFLSFRSFVIRGCSCIAFWDGRQPVPILTTLWSWGRVVRNIFKDTMDSLTHLLYPSLL